MFKLKFENLAYWILLCLAFVLGACAAPITPGSGSQGTTMTLFVDARQVDCVGVAPQKCLLTKTDPNGEWEFFYDSIEGFDFEEGYAYELLVETFDVANPPADGSSIRYELVEVVSQEAVETNNAGTSVYVDGIEIVIMESFPVQAAVLVRGNLADGCVVLDGISAERNGSTFELTINSHKEGDACTLALVPFEQNVPLDVAELKAGTYTVVAGDASAEFTLDIDNGEKEETVESDTVITLERTACYGTCPIYTITIYGDGRVVYDGKDFVDVTGEQEIGLNPQLISELVEFMTLNGYFELEDEYTEYNITDMPSAITSLTTRDGTKRIEHYFGDDSAPILLHQIENKIDELTNSAQWTGQDPAESGNWGVFGSIVVRGLENDSVELPAGAVIHVRLEDVSLQDAPSVVIGEQTYSDVTNLPTFFDIAFDLNAIDPNGMFSVSAEVKSAAGELLYWTDTVHSVLTFGAGTMVDIELVSTN